MSLALLSVLNRLELYYYAKANRQAGAFFESHQGFQDVTVGFFRRVARKCVLAPHRRRKGLHNALVSIVLIGLRRYQRALPHMDLCHIALVDHRARPKKCAADWSISDHLNQRSITMAVKPLPDGYHTATPYLSVNDATRAIDC